MISITSVTLKINRFVTGRILKDSSAMRNCGRWSDIIAVRLSDIILVEVFGKISIIVFEVEVTLRTFV